MRPLDLIGPPAALEAQLKEHWALPDLESGANHVIEGEEIEDIFWTYTSCLLPPLLLDVRLV